MFVYMTAHFGYENRILVNDGRVGAALTSIAGMLSIIASMVDFLCSNKTLRVSAKAIFVDDELLKSFGEKKKKRNSKYIDDLCAVGGKDHVYAVRCLNCRSKTSELSASECAIQIIISSDIVVQKHQINIQIRRESSKNLRLRGSFVYSVSVHYIDCA